MSRIRPRFAMAAAALFAAIVFVIDLHSPKGIEEWVLYLPAILTPVLLKNRRATLLFGAACSALVVLGALVSPTGANPPWWDWLNRGMGLMALGLMTAMGVALVQRSVQLSDAVSALREESARHQRTSRDFAESEERLRLAVEGAGMGAFDANLVSGKSVWSAAHREMLGYGRDTRIEADVGLWQSHICAEDLGRVLQAREQALRDHSLFAVECRIRRADDGKVAWMAIFGRFHYSPSGEAVRFVGVSFDVTRRKELEREVLEIAAREQRQIGQELHDGAGQALTGLGLMAQTLAELLMDRERERRIAMRIVAELDQLHQQLRTLSRGLLPVAVEAKGLSAALEELAASATQRSGVPVVFECPEWVELPEHAVALQLFRISQEAVTNALRHGQPRSIHLSIHSQPSGLRLRIKDDGVGIRRQPSPADGLGIRIMEHRAGLIGGALRIEPAEGGGTVVTCTLARRPEDGDEERGSRA